MDHKTFSIDFFTIRTDKDSSFIFTEYLEELINGESPHVYTDSSNTFAIKKVSKDKDYYYCEFCKFRMDGLPHAGSATSDDYELPIDSTDGLVEKNHFAYKFDDGVVIFQRNGNASRGQKMGSFLSDLYNETITLSPIVTGDSLKKIMSGKVEPTMLEVSISRPTSKSIFPPDDFSKNMFHWMSAAGGARIHFKLTSDQRSSSSDRNNLSSNIKQTIENLFGREDVSVLRSQVRDENGLIEPIDLIADRIYSHKQVKMDGRYPNVSLMNKGLKLSFEEKSSEIYEVIGNKNERLT